MYTAIDFAVDNIRARGYHNHRNEDHSDDVCTRLLDDLLEMCPALQRDFEDGVVKATLNYSSPGDRKRRIDLLVAEPGDDGRPDLEKVRIGVENKSVVTAHRNGPNRFDDLTKVLKAMHKTRPEAILVATVLVGVALDVLNVPDKMKLFFENEDEFRQKGLPRLSSGDPSLWKEFKKAVSHNKAYQPEQTVARFKHIPTRNPAETHKEGYDYLLIVPVHIDNVNPPYVARDNTLGVDHDADYEKMLRTVCWAYTARWHIEELG